MMIEYIKKYGINNQKYELIISKSQKDVLDFMTMNEENIKKNLDYFNSIGISDDIANIIIERPDLIIMPSEVLKSTMENVNHDLLINIIKNNICDLILLGV